MKADASHHGWQLPARDTFSTPASAITLVRTIVAVTLASVALMLNQENLVLWALGVYWAGDIADGLIARWLKHEMRKGAVLDIICDRVCAISIYGAFVLFDPQMAVPVMLYLFQFAVLDTPLSLSFLRWPLLSPNYFFLVDKAIYRYNWSILAKAFNSATFILVAIILGDVWLALLVASINTAIKIVSLHRLYTRVLPKSASAA